MAKVPVFIREATGLVREIPPYQLIIFNFLTVPVINILMFSVNWNPNFFPGADLNVALVVATLVAIPMYLTYAIIYSAFPKTGTDYVFQSRVLSPGIGFASTFASWVFFQFWYIALEGVTVVNMFLIPWLFNVAQITGNSSYVGLANSLSSPTSLAILSFAYVIGGGLILMGGIRVYLKVQTILFLCMAAAIVAFIIMLTLTSNAAFASNLNSQLSGLIGSPDVYSKVISTAQSEGVALSPTVSLFTSIGGMITPWTLGLEFAMFGNLALGGETKSASLVKTQIITILGAFAMIMLCMFVLWNLFVGMVGQTFWSAVATLAWNADPLFAKLPSLFYTQPASFVFLYGTNNLVLSTVWAIGASAGTLATTFTIYIVTTRMIFAQTFDRLFPAKFAYVTEHTRSPIYIMIAMIAVACGWTYAFIFYGSSMFSYLASVQFMISASIIMTMIGAIVLPLKLKHRFEQSPVKSYRVAIIPLAVLGILGNLLVMYYLAVVPALAGVTPQSMSLIAGVFLISVIYYFAVRAFRKGEGIDIGQVFKELPPD